MFNDTQAEEMEQAGFFPLNYDTLMKKKQLSVLLQELFLFLNCEGGGGSRKMPSEIVELNSETAHSGQQGKM